MRTIRIGFLGLGVVGQGVWKHVLANQATLEARLGVRLELVRAGVRDRNKARAVAIPSEKLTENLAEVVEDPEIDLICELMGGTDTALDLTLRAFRLGKTVVTANKALICEHGARLFRTARSHGAHYFFEASVAGGIPIIKILQEGLVANRFPLIFGILNGTSNYILTRMEREGLTFAQTLDDARRLGYVEADEALDLDGVDAAHKTAILAYLAHGLWVPLKAMRLDGIRRVSQEDLAMARELGYKVKLLASIRTIGGGESEAGKKGGSGGPGEAGAEGGELALAVSVLPSLIARTEVLAGVDEVYNGVCVEGDVVGRTVFIGRGAGQDATASAVISDIADAVRVLEGYPLLEGTAEPAVRRERKLAKAEAILGRFYLRLRVRDRPGVLARITPVLAANGVSLATVNQRPRPEAAEAMLFLTTHRTSEAALQRTLRGLRRLRADILEEPVVLRIFDC